MTMKQDLEIIANDFNELKRVYFQDEIKAKEIFNIQTDGLCKSGCISQRTYDNVYLTGNKKTGRLYIKCGSYSQEIK